MNKQLVIFGDDTISGYCPEFSDTRTITVTYEIDSIKGKPGFTKWRYKEFDCDDKKIAVGLKIALFLKAQINLIHRQIFF